jgi:hypothetical protein
MGMHIDDGLNQYTVVDGKMVPIEPTSMTFAVGDQKLFDYTQSGGVLKLNPTMVPLGSLEQMIRMASESGEKGINLKFTLPPLGEKTFNGVREVRAMTTEEQKYDPTLRTEFQPLSEPKLQYDRNREQTPERFSVGRKLLGKIRDRINRYTGW